MIKLNSLTRNIGDAMMESHLMNKMITSVFLIWQERKVENRVQQM